MFKIIFLSCLVMAMAEGAHANGNNTSFELMTNYINLRRLGFSEVLQNYDKTLNNFNKDFSKSLMKLNRELSEIPHIIDENNKCQTAFDDHIDLEKSCFHSNMTYCKSIVKGCIILAGNHVSALLKGAIQTKAELQDFVVQNFEKNIANCTQQMLNIPTSNYNECVLKVVNQGNTYSFENQYKFNGKMEEAIKMRRKVLKKLKILVTAYKYRPSEQY